MATAANNIYGGDQSVLGTDIISTSVCDIFLAGWITNLFFSLDSHNRLEGTLIRREKRRGFIPEDGSFFESFALQMDRTLFQAIIRNPDNVLPHLCRERPALPYTLRPRPHPF